MASREEHKYDLFISYATDPDYLLARKIKSFLDTFHKIPSPEHFKLRPLRVCVDGLEFSLPRSEEVLVLGDAIPTVLESHLAQSAELLVLCSANSRDSLWVHREVQWFLDNRGSGSIRLAVTEGFDPGSRPQEVFSEQISQSGLTQKIWYDFRQTRGRLARQWRKVRTFDDEKTRLAADLLGQPVGMIQPLWYRDQRRRARTRFVVACASIVVLGVLAGALYQQKDESRRQEAIAKRERDIAVSGRLAAQARNLFYNHHPLALLLSLESLRIAQTDDAIEVLALGLSRSPAIKTVFVSRDQTPTSAALSPDERVLAIGREDGSLVLWDVEAKRDLAHMPGAHGAKVVALAYGAKGNVLASLDQTSRIAIWDVANRKLIDHLPYTAGMAVNVLAFSPDGAKLSVGSSDGTLVVWDTATLRPVFEPLKGHEGELSGLVFSPSGTTLASGGRNPTVVLWDVKTGKIKHRLKGHHGGARCVAFNPAGTLLASGGANHEIIIWDVHTGKEFAVLNSDSPQVMQAVAFSADGQQLFSLGGWGDIHLWNIGMRRLIYRTRAEWRSTGFRPAFSPASNTLITGAYKNKIWLWDISKPNALTRHFSGLTDTVMALGLGADGSTFISVGRNGPQAIRWDLRSGRKVRRLIPNEQRYALSAAVSVDGKMLATGCDDGSIILWDLIQGRQAAEPLIKQRAQARGLSFSPDGRILATGHEDGMIYFWEPQGTQKPIRFISAHKGWAAALAFSPDGKRLASGAFNPYPPYESVGIWDVVTGRSLKSLGQHYGAVGGLQYSPDGSTLAAGFADGTVIVWNLTNESDSGRPLKGLDVSVMALTFSSDGRLLAAGTNDGKICLWDVPTGQSKGRFQSPFKDIISTLAFTRDGKQLISGGWHGALTAWNIDSGSWTEIACQVCDRNLTEREWQTYLPGKPYRETCPERSQ